MKKFFIFSALPLVAFFAFVSTLDRPLPYLLETKGSCPFCDEERYGKQQIFEGDKIRVILNYKPVAQGHILIIPKRHVERFEDLTAEEYVEIGSIIKRMQRAFAKAYNKPDYVLIVQNGYYGGQTVNHAHMHMIPRGNESSLMMKIKLWQIILTQSVTGDKPLSEEKLNKEIVEIRQALKDTQ